MVSCQRLKRTELSRLTAPDAFRWATGIEDTFIVDPWPKSGRTLDEYALTDHYGRWRQDVDRVAELGVDCVRWGVPWHLVNPARGRWSWRWTDRVIERLLAVGVEPIVDLVHYGVPAWITDGFLSTDFPARMAEYAGRVADRYAGRLRWYTPLNEPRIAAWYCGRLGWWPPYRRTWRGFVDILVALCRGIVETERALRAVDPEIVCVHVDATDAFRTADASLRAEVRLRQQVVFLALDLVTGRVTERHPLRGWLRAHGVSDDALAWFAERPVVPDVVGINMYPMFSGKVLSRHGGTLRVRMPYERPALLSRLALQYWTRYRRPVMVTETASLGRRRRAWLDGSVAAVRRLRTRGVPVVGYTWWPLFSLVGWSYRQGRRSVHASLLHMGLWDLARDLERRRTPLVDAYRAMTTGGVDVVGRLTTS